VAGRNQETTPYPRNCAERSMNMKTKTISVTEGRNMGIEKLPNFSKTGSVTGMKNKYYGKDALLVKCGLYIYNCTERPDIYNAAH